MKCRLLRTGRSDAQWNMAVDEAVAQCVGRGDSLPTLRFFGWLPAAVSVGYGQSIAEGLNLDRVAALGWGIVRRQTGGGAVFHHHEVTYSLALARDTGPGASPPMGCHRAISRGLIAALSLMGIEAAFVSEPGPGGSAPEKTEFNCFAVPANSDVVVGKRKIAGSAQTRKRSFVLEHGSMLMARDIGIQLDMSRFPSSSDREEAGRRLRENTTSVEDELGREVSFEEVSSALRRGFAQAMGLSLFEAGLTAKEEDLAEELKRTKYAASAWTFRR